MAGKVAVTKTELNSPPSGNLVVVALTLETFGVRVDSRLLTKKMMAALIFHLGFLMMTLDVVGRRRTL